MQGGVRRPVYKIVFKQHSHGARIRIKSPSSVSGWIMGDVVDLVVQDLIPAVNPGQKIHSAKIAGHTLTQIMDLVELDHVIVGEVATIVPVEANRDCSVVEVRYLIVFDQNVVSVAHQNAKAHGSHSATTGDQVVPEVDALVCQRFVGRIGVAQ